jgi:hypothetical protein
MPLIEIGYTVQDPTSKSITHHTAYAEVSLMPEDAMLQPADVRTHLQNHIHNEIRQYVGREHTGHKLCGWVELRCFQQVNVKYLFKPAHASWQEEGELVLTMPEAVWNDDARRNKFIRGAIMRAEEWQGNTGSIVQYTAGLVVCEEVRVIPRAIFVSVVGPKADEEETTFVDDYQSRIDKAREQHESNKRR